MTRFTLLLTLAAAAARAQSPVQFEGRAGALLENDRLQLITLDQGGAFVSLLLKDDAQHVNPMWDPIRMAREAKAPSRFGSSLGHFVCVDGFGPSSAEEQRAGLQGHGEAHRLPWTRTSAGGTAGVSTWPIASICPWCRRTSRAAWNWWTANRWSTWTANSKASPPSTAP